MKKVYIDPGHGGHDSGAYDGTGPGDNIVTKEKELNLKVALKVNEALVRSKVSTRMSRTTDVYPSLTQRYQGANNFGADAFISIHFNAGPSTAKGMEVLYPRGFGLRQSRSKSLAQKIYNNLKGTTPWADRTVYADRRGLAVLNSTKMPAVIVELDFITNIEAEKLVNNAVWQKLAGEAIAEAVCEYLGVAFVRSTGVKTPVKAPAKTPAKAPSKPASTLLKLGSKGEHVKKLQRALNANGASLSVDGDFGSKTEAAVKTFQRNNKLVVDGIVGPATWGALAKPCHVVSKMPTLKLKSKGNYVKHLQKDLNRHGAALKIDGDFGSRTEAAVKAFQRKKKLSADAVVGPKTWKALL